VSVARPDGTGTWLLAYTPRETFEDGGDVVRVRSGTLVATRPIRLLAPMSRLVLSPHVGLVLPTAGATGIRAGAELVGWWRVASQQLGLGLDLTWAGLGATERLRSATGFATFDGDVRYLTLLASGTWRRPLGQRSVLWLSAGAGAVHATSTVALSDQPTVTESGWAPAVGASAAWGLRFGVGCPFLELRTTWQGNPHVASVRGGFVPVSLSLGYRLGLL
jgi:hypothetical protein